MLIALSATVTIAGTGSSKNLPLEKFFILPTENIRHENILKDGEIITEIQLPAPVIGSRSTYLKFKERESLDFAMSAVAANVQFSPDKTVQQARLVLGGVAPKPWRVAEAEAFLIGKKLDEPTIAQAATLALKDADPLEHNAYKITLTSTLVRRALTKLNA